METSPWEGDVTIGSSREPRWVVELHPQHCPPGRTASPGKRSSGSRFKQSSARKPYQTTPCRPRRSRPTAHPGPPFGGLDPGVPDEGRPTARGASEARAGQPRLLCGERVHGGWRWRTTGPRRVAGAGHRSGPAAGRSEGAPRGRGRRARARGGGAGARAAGASESSGPGARPCGFWSGPIRGAPVPGQHTARP